MTLCKILEGLLPKEASHGSPPPDKKLLEHHFVFACVWAFGGAMAVDKVRPRHGRGRVAAARLLQHAAPAACTLWRAHAMHACVHTHACNHAPRPALTPACGPPPSSAVQVSDYRAQFSRWWTSEWKAVAFPEKGLVYDYYVDEPNVLMAPWEEAVGRFGGGGGGGALLPRGGGPIDASSLFVPTMETTRLMSLLGSLVGNRCTAARAACVCACAQRQRLLHFVWARWQPADWVRQQGLLAAAVRLLTIMPAALPRRARRCQALCDARGRHRHRQVCDDDGTPAGAGPRGRRVHGAQPQQLHRRAAAAGALRAHSVCLPAMHHSGAAPPRCRCRR